MLVLISKKVFLQVLKAYDFTAFVFTGIIMCFTAEKLCIAYVQLCSLLIQHNFVNDSKDAELQKKSESQKKIRNCCNIEKELASYE